MAIVDLEVEIDELQPYLGPHVPSLQEMSKINGLPLQPRGDPPLVEQSNREPCRRRGRNVLARRDNTTVERHRRAERAAAIEREVSKLKLERVEAVEPERSIYSR